MNTSQTAVSSTNALKTFDQVAISGSGTVQNGNIQRTSSQSNNTSQPTQNQAVKRLKSSGGITPHTSMGGANRFSMGPNQPHHQAGNKNPIQIDSRLQTK